MKRTMAWILAALMIASMCCLFPATAIADTSGSGWTLTGGVLTVTTQSACGNASSSKESYGWDSVRSQITEAVVADGITEIGKYAFGECANMTKITFGKDVTKLGMDSLSRNPKLKTIVFNGPITYLAQGVPYLTNNITSITLTGQTFAEFKAVGVKTAYNFKDYGGITTGFDTATYIVNMPFEYALADGVLTLSGVDAVVGQNDYAASDYPWYAERSQITKVIVEEGVAAIGAHAFDGCANLVQIEFASTVASIGPGAFANAPKLKNILFGALPTSIGEGAARGSGAIASVVLADCTEEEFKNVAKKTKYNLAANGGVATGLDSASYTTVCMTGVWADFGALNAFGEAAKNNDVNKDGCVNISDVSTILNYLMRRVSWKLFYDVDASGATNIADVTTLLTALEDCAHIIVFTDEAEATCTVDGHTAYRYCVYCEQAVNDFTVYPAPGHTVVIDRAVPATCGADGLTQGSHCRVCKEVLTAQVVVPATGNHTMVNTPAVAPTCGDAGFKAGLVCSVCGLDEREVVPATGDHTTVTDAAVAATCTKSGLSEGSHCTACGNIVVPQEIIEPLGHSYSSEDSRCVRCHKASYELLAGKKALFLGDSLCMASTHDKEHQWWGWAGRINAAYHLSSYKNAGVDGASVSNCRNTNTIISQLNSNKNGGYKFVILEGSTNDAWDSVAVGTVTAGSAGDADPSNFNLSTFAGGLENLFYYAKKYYPNAYIGYIFNYPMNSGIGSLRNMTSYLRIAKAVCEKWDIPMLNFYESADFQVKDFAGISTIVPDGIHPSSKGYDMIYPVIARFMAEIALDDSFAIYDAAAEVNTNGPLPYARVPDKDREPQEWMKWLMTYGDDSLPWVNGSAYSISYKADDGVTYTSPWEFWGGHFQFDYVFAKSEIDASANVGASNYGFTWEIWYKDADVDEDFRYITTKPWSCYPGDNVIYRIDTYDQGMTDMHTDEGANNEYQIVIFIYNASGDLVACRKDIINYNLATEHYMDQALAAGAIGN